MKSSTSSKINHRSDAQSRFSPICHWSGYRSTAHSTIARDTKPSIAGTFEDIWKNLFSKASSRSTFSPWGNFHERRMPRLPKSRRNHLILGDWLTFRLPFKWCTPFLTFSLYCILNKYCFMLYILQIQSSSICPDDGIFPHAETTMTTFRRWDVPPLWDGLRDHPSVTPWWCDFPHSEADHDLTLMGYAPTQRFTSVHS